MFDGDPDLYEKNSVRNLGGPFPLPKFGGPGTSEFRRNFAFAQLRDLMANIFGTQKSSIGKQCCKLRTLLHRQTQLNVLWSTNGENRMEVPPMGGHQAGPSHASSLLLSSTSKVNSARFTDAQPLKPSLVSEIYDSDTVRPKLWSSWFFAPPIINSMFNCAKRQHQVTTIKPE